MIVFKIIGIVSIVLVALLLVAFVVQPALITLPYTLFIKLFVKNPPYLELDKHFPNHQILQENWDVIKSELMGVLENEESIPKFHDVDGIQRFISARDEIPWRTFIIKAYGKWAEGNLKKAPATTRLLKQMPQVTSAMFSILDGGKHIPPHMGFFKGVLRYHLGLVVPDDAPCYILVDGKKYNWKEGEGVLFDDTFTHEVWNKSTQRRAVLFCDVYRENDLPKWVQFFNRRIFKMLNHSSRLKKVMKKAEVTQDVKVPQP